jgi:hypothetical protein
MISICRAHSANVKRWRDGQMALRWCAAGMVEAGKQFRRVNGHLQCGSSQQSVHFAAAGLIAGQYDVVVAGGLESMSRVPLSWASRDASPFPEPFLDRYDVARNQGIGAEMIAERWGFSRLQLDEYSVASHENPDGQDLRRRGRVCSVPCPSRGRPHHGATGGAAGGDRLDDLPVGGRYVDPGPRDLVRAGDGAAHRPVGARRRASGQPAAEVGRGPPAGPR